MKKGGIIAAIIIISIFISIFICLQIVKDDLPRPKFGNIKKLNVESEISNVDNTYITANFTVNNTAPEYMGITISYDSVECQLFYYDEYIGNLILNLTEFNFSNYINNNDLEGVSNENVEEFIPVSIQNISSIQKKIDKTISGGENLTIYTLFNLSNEAISKVFYNHTMKNKERGEIRFELNFSLEFKLPLDIAIPIKQNISIGFENEIITDILEEIGWMKYNCSVSESNLTYYPILNRTKLSIFKKSESNIINFNSSKRFLGKPKPRYDLYIGDSPYWIFNSEPYNISIGQEMILYGKPWRLMLLNILFPIEGDLIVNNDNETIIGLCKIYTVERDYKFSESKRIELSVTINGSKFGKIINEHIKNENYTEVNITNIVINNRFRKLMNISPNIINRIIPIDEINTKLFNSTATISDLITEIELKDVSFDLSESRQFLFFLQMLTLVVIINTTIIVIILYFAFWNKGKYLIFNK